MTEGSELDFGEWFVEEREAGRAARTRARRGGDGGEPNPERPRLWTLKSKTLDGVIIDFETTLIDVGDTSTSVVDVLHVFVPSAMRGRGVAERAVLQLVDIVRSRRLLGCEKMVATCSYVSETFLPNHPELATLFVDRPHPY